MTKFSEKLTKARKNPSDPAQETSSVFSGTFCDYNDYAHYFIGDLVLENGNSYRWGAMSDGDDFGRLIRTITTLDIEYEDAVEELVERTTGAGVSYNSSIPYI